MRKLVRIGLVALVPPLLGSAFYTPQLARERQAEALMDGGNSRLTSIASHEEVLAPELRDERDESEGPVDLLGNEVTDAVAKYKFDATGSLYETHSPQTELPRLGSPKS